MQNNSERRTSEILQEIIDTPDHGRMTVGRFTGMLGDRAFALAILVFSLPNSLPIPGIPGFSTITGLPITFIGVQMMLGRQQIWLPKKIAEREFSHATLAKLLTKAMPFVIWMEKFLKPRFTYACSRKAERFLGLLFAILSLVISLPIPFGNFLPGLSMSLIALGLLENDGLFVMSAVAFALGGLAFMYKVIVLAATKAAAIVTGWFW